MTQPFLTHDLLNSGQNGEPDHHEDDVGNVGGDSDQSVAMELNLPAWHYKEPPVQRFVLLRSICPPHLMEAGQETRQEHQP